MAERALEKAAPEAQVQNQPGNEPQMGHAAANGQAGDAAVRRMATQSSGFHPGNDPLGQKEKVLEPFFKDMAEVAQQLAPQFTSLGLHFRPEILLATALQESAAVDPANARSFDNGLGIMQLTPFNGQMDENVAKAIGWDNNASVEYNVAHSRWRDAKANILGGGLVMLNKARAIKGGASRVWGEMDEAHRWRATMFAYNAGEGSAINALNSGGPNAPMISRYMYQGVWHEHDYTAELKQKQDYVDSHDPFANGGVQGGGPSSGGNQSGGQTGGGTKTGGNSGGKTPGGQNGGGAAAQVPQQDLRRGMEGPAVKQLQEDLVKLHYLSEEDLATGPGIFGPHTEHALKEFQKDHDVAQTGYFGPASRAALESALGAGKKQQKPAQDQGGQKQPGGPSDGGGAKKPEGGGQGQQGTKGDVPIGDLSVGDKGPQVLALQKDLVKLHYLSDADMQTGPGIFGPHTMAALEAFQGAYGIAVTGRYDAATRNELVQALDGKKPKHPSGGGAEPPGAEAAISFCMSPGVNDLNPRAAFGGWHYYCLHLVNVAYRDAGHPGKHLSVPTAYQSYLGYHGDGAVHTAGNPPRGALVFYSWTDPKTGINEGHIGISLGNGDYVGTGYDGVNAATIVRPIQSGSYLGWALPAA